MTGLLAGMLCLLAQAVSASTLFFEDFKDNGANVAPGLLQYNWDDNNHDMVVTETRTGELIEFNTTANGWHFNSYSFDYPASDTLTWDASQHQYLQAYFPWKNDSDLIALQAKIDGGGITGDMWANRLDNAQQWYHTQPTLVDVNAMFGLTGVHEIQFRFFFISTQYAADAPNEHIVEGTWDWVRGGMRAGANINIAKYCVGWPAAGGRILRRRSCALPHAVAWR
ncbi:MAG TPA: hypothetical protein PLG73_14770, partial [Candidatus Sumerlaeota bacterium]|nr:hypothetical protein [Candidatus Sumerlaeota bacterium]